MLGDEITIRSNGLDILYPVNGKIDYYVYESFYPKPLERGLFGKKHPRGKIALNQLVSITKSFQSTDEYQSSNDCGDCAKIFAKLVEMEFPHIGYNYSISGGSVKVELSDGKVYELLGFRKSNGKYVMDISETIEKIMSDRKYQLKYMASRSLVTYTIKPYLIPADFKAAVDEFNVMHAKFLEIARKNDEAKEEMRRKQLEYEEKERNRIASVTASQAEELFRNL